MRKGIIACSFFAGALVLVCNTDLVQAQQSGIRYQSPTIAGFAIGNNTEDDYWDAALRYAGEFGGFRVAAGVGYESGRANFSSNNSFDRFFAADAASTWRSSDTWGRVSADVRVEFGKGRVKPFVGVGGSFGESEAAIAVQYAIGDTVSIRLHYNPNVFNVTGGAKIGLFGIPDTSARVYLAPSFGMSLQMLRLDQNGSAGGTYSSSTTVHKWAPTIGVEAQLDVAAMELYVGYKHYFNGVSGTTTGQTAFAQSISMGKVDIDSVVTAGARIRY